MDRFAGKRDLMGADRPAFLASHGRNDAKLN